MVDSSPPLTDSRGVVYVATGKKYYDEACISARSLKASSRLRTAIFTDQPPASGDFDLHIPVVSTGDGFLDKVVHLKDSPFEQTLFLDTDTFVCADLSDVFGILEQFDLAAAHDHLVREVYPVAGVPQAFPELNTGVLLFRKTPKVLALLDDWVETFKVEKELFLKKQIAGKGFPDQPPFRKALFSSGLRIAVLPPEYNCMFRYTGSVVGEVKIMHCARIGYGWYAYDNLKRAAQLLNSRITARVFCNGELFAFRRKPRTILPSWRDSYERESLGRLFPPLWLRRLNRKLSGSSGEK